MNIYEAYEEKEVVNNLTYRSFNGWKHFGFRIKKGQRSPHYHPIFGAMFSSEQVYNPAHRYQGSYDDNSYDMYDGF